MKAWVRRRAKRRRDGRLVLVTSVVFDAEVFDELCDWVEEDQQRSAVVNAAVKFALGVPGWVEGVVKREEAAEEVSSRGRAGPGERRGGPSSRRVAPSSRGMRARQ